MEVYPPERHETRDLSKLVIVYVKDMYCNITLLRVNSPSVSNQKLAKYNAL